MEALIKWDGPTAYDEQSILGKQSYVTRKQYGQFLLRDGRVFVRLRSTKATELVGKVAAIT